MKIGDHSAIAIFNALWNIQMVNDACEDMIKVLKEHGLVENSFDTILTAESKSVIWLLI